MDWGAADWGRGCQGPGYTNYCPSDRHVVAARKWQYGVRCYPQALGNTRHLSTDRSHYSLTRKRRSIASEQDFNHLIKRERFVGLNNAFYRYGLNYNGKSHSRYATSVKRYTLLSGQPLSYREQELLIPFLHAFKPARSWSWLSLTTIIHSFTTAGVFTPQQFSNENIRLIQASLLTDLLDCLLHRCRQTPATSGIDAMGIANVLWAMAKLVDNGLELFPRLKETVAAVLSHVSELKDHFKPQEFANLLWATAKLLDNGQEMTAALNDTLATLFPRVDALKEQFSPQHITNLLWAMAKLMDNRYERTPALDESVVTLLPRLHVLKDQFNPQGITNLLWALAKLVDTGLELSSECKAAVVTLLFRVHELKDRFIPQHIANLLWAMAKLVDKGYELTPQLEDAAAALLLRVPELKDHFIPQHIASLLWSMAKLVDHGQELSPDVFEAVAVLQLLKDHFISQQIINLPGELRETGGEWAGAEPGVEQELHDSCLSPVTLKAGFKQ